MTDAVAAVRADRDLVADVNDHVASLVRTPQWPAHCHAWTVQAARSCGQGWQLQWLDAQNEQLCGQDHVACIVCARVLLGPDLALADDGDVRAASTEESEQLRLDGETPYHQVCVDFGWGEQGARGLYVAIQEAFQPVAAR
ncbi:MAG: hypothetical protein DMF90_13040 [Acidobacteria bacterium]|nr:MAG: hypothetical protein DMF90_13040 [Acidobacteriota bacterium]